MLIVIAIIIISVFIRYKSIKSILNVEPYKETEPYVRNKLGFYKNSNILEERYDDNGNLIYCKYKLNDEIKEDNYNYKYDKQNRVVQIMTNDNESTLNIEYTNNEISKITTNYEITFDEYEFHNTNEGMIINKYTTSNITLAGQEPLNHEFTEQYIIYTKKIDEKSYSLIIEADKNGKIKRKKIYENENKKPDNIFKQLSIRPIFYIDLLSNKKFSNIIMEFIGCSISLPIFNQGKEIYSENNGSTTKYVYDKNGRILYEYNYDSNNDGTEFYYKYEEESEDKSYIGTYLITGTTNGLRAISIKDNNLVGKLKFYLDKNNEIYKYETFEEYSVSDEECAKLKEECLEYIEKNKIDSDQIKSKFSEYINKNKIDIKKFEADIKTKNSQESSISKAYKEILEQYIKETQKNAYITVEYALTDINDDGIKELIIMSCSSNADYKFTFYTFKNNEAIKLGSNDCGASSLYKMKKGSCLKQVYIHGGGEIVWNITYKSNEFEVEKIKERSLTVEEEMNGDFTEGDKLIEFYESDNTKELDKI